MMKSKGVLKIKLGYNANSSATTSIVSVFEWGSVFALTIICTVMSFIYSKKKKTDEDSFEKGGESDEKD